MVLSTTAVLVLRYMYIGNVDGQSATRENVDFQIVTIKMLQCTLTNLTYLGAPITCREHQTPAVDN
jgi:hypothetical protein